MLLRPQNKLIITTEPAILNMPRPMFDKTLGLGKIRKEMPDEIKLLTWAQQFRPLKINGRNVFQSYCAYGGLALPLKVSPETGFRKFPNEVQGNVDHIIPNGHGGNDSIDNYQLLSEQFNLSPMKGEKKTLHVVASAFRRGGTIGGRSFEPMWDLFIWNFNNFHSGPNRASDIELSSWWPWWLRKKYAPYAPYLPGYDEKRREMICTPQDSLRMEFGILAWNVLLFDKYCPSGEIKKALFETFEREYSFTPAEMVKFRREI